MNPRQRYSLSTSVFVIVRQQESVLLLRRAQTGWMDGFFSLPAGAHDGGEPLDIAAARELREETGLDVDAGQMKLLHLLHCRSGDTDSEWLGAFFLAENWRGMPQLLEHGKHDHLGWYALDTLPSDMIPYARQGLECAMSGTTFSTFGWQRD
ncbi:NUDIX hydrolase [Dyella sp. 20L07]|uniref:NUDIX hydrolase n=1 Tax=Dyella sp. 20L07 TaxID=3384240 RepID=UPI003D286A5D